MNFPSVHPRPLKVCSNFCINALEFVQNWTKIKESKKNYIEKELIQDHSCSYANNFKSMKVIQFSIYWNFLLIILDVRNIVQFLQKTKPPPLRMPWIVQRWVPDCIGGFGTDNTRLPCPLRRSDRTPRRVCNSSPGMSCGGLSRKCTPSWSCRCHFPPDAWLSGRTSARPGWIAMRNSCSRTWTA